MSHSELNLVGRCDVLTGTGGAVSILEYKATPVRRVAEVTEAMRVQLALQRLCLEDAGTLVESQGIYFTNHRRRVNVTLTQADLEEAVGYVHRTREIIDAEGAPAPLVDDPRCRSCSHLSVCLPGERRAGVRPRVHASDPDGEILHLTTQGCRASISKGRLRVVKGDDELASVPLERLVGLVVQGNVDVSGAAIRELLWRAVPIVWCSGRGKVVGWSRPAHSPNGVPRVSQHVQSASGRIDIAAEFISAKITNQATQLRRNGNDLHKADVNRLRELARAAHQCASLEEVLGVEGEAASLYFRSFPQLWSGSDADLFRTEWPGRSGRGARDRANAALNFLYGLLLADTIRGLVACGLDPHAGFLHSSGRNKPALALDLMEEFRAPVADSAFLSALNNGSLRHTMFYTGLGNARLTDQGRRALTAAYERRATTSFEHPVFRYRVTWRRAVEVQARLLLGCIDGTQPSYRGMRTR